MTPLTQQSIIDRISTLSFENIEITTLLGELSVTVSVDKILPLLSFLRDDHTLMFKQLIDICAVDYLGRSPRYDIVYHLLSLQFNCRIRLKVAVDESDATPSAIHIFSTANWFEREIFDLYGLVFMGHPNLHRILTDYNFQGHPLRKDFPLSGYVEPLYDPIQKKVVYNPVVLPQEFRDFDFLSPWEGMTPQRPVLPGDEKANVTIAPKVTGTL